MGRLIQLGLHKRNKAASDGLYHYSDGITKVKLGSARLNELERLSEKFQISVSEIVRQMFDYAIDDIREKHKT